MQFENQNNTNIWYDYSLIINLSQFWLARMINDNVLTQESRCFKQGDPQIMITHVAGTIVYNTSQLNSVYHKMADEHNKYDI